MSRVLLLVVGVVVGKLATHSGLYGAVDVASHPTDEALAAAAAASPTADELVTYDKIQSLPLRLKPLQELKPPRPLQFVMPEVRGACVSWSLTLTSR
jgi:hypothetical protein